ncbi:glycosyltransferase [Micrococcus terreus]|uniref:glycosyltransferase n=1 Tax=Micrococcus terreus TaxID=574650 RepID=UPI003409D982
MSQIADTYVLAGDRVNPIFTDDHLRQKQISRRYATGTSRENDVTVLRLRTAERRSMLYAMNVPRYIDLLNPDLVIQVMPGQILPALASGADSKSPRLALYGDNSAMWAKLSPSAQKIKWRIFANTKGRIYAHVNKRAIQAFGYTPETATRLSPFNDSSAMEVLPLTYPKDVYFYDPDLRTRTRVEYGIHDDESAVLVAGKLQVQKRIEAVAAAVASRIRAGEKLKLIIAGNDSSEASNRILGQISAIPELRGKTVLTGFLTQSELNGVFNASDAGIWPAMPAITIQQAMGTGLPVVIPSNQIVGHLLKSGTGLFLDSKKPLDSSIEDALVALSQMNVDRTEFAARNYWLSSEAVANALTTFARVRPS